MNCKLLKTFGFTELACYIISIHHVEVSVAILKLGQINPNLYRKCKEYRFFCLIRYEGIHQLLWKNTPVSINVLTCHFYYKVNILMSSSLNINDWWHLFMHVVKWPFLGGNYLLSLWIFFYRFPWKNCGVYISSKHIGRYNKKWGCSFRRDGFSTFNNFHLR